MNKSKSDVWMPIYIGDLLADTQHLTDEQFGKYHKLLYHQWRNGHYSEDEMWAICGFAGLSFESASSTSQAELKQVFSRVLAPIKQMLSKDKGDLWFSPRCDYERAKWSEKKRVFVERAKKGGDGKERRRREILANMEVENPASSSASRVLQGMLESCTSPSPKEQKQKLTPTPSAPRKGLDRAGPDVQKSVNKAKHSKSGPVGGSKKTNGSYPHQEDGSAKYPPRNVSNGHLKNRAEPTKQDLRWESFRSEVLKFWEAQNPGGSKCPWNRFEDRALNDLLQANKEMVLRQFVQLLQNRAASKINPSIAPHKWLRSITEFTQGPLNKFRLPEERRSF